VECPLATLGGKETGGMNVYVRELSRELGRQGKQIDIFTRAQDPTIAPVRDLAPNKSYRLERAADTNVDGNCTGTAWLTLGRGLAPQAITTDDKGTGRAELFRNLGTTALGTTFDIKFHVIDATTSAVVLESACYQFKVSL